MQYPKKLEKFDIRKINWDFADMNERTCPLCNNQEAELQFIRPDGLNVKYCEICGTYFISPAPSQKQIVDFYSHYDISHRTELEYSWKKLKMNLEYSDPMNDYRIKTLNKLMIFGNARIFDVGFGRASFLALVKKIGAIPFGNEFDEKLIELAKYLGIENTYLGDISYLNYNEYFDLVSLNDVIEHPLEPASLMQDAVRIAKPNGLISIWTPNGECGPNRDDNLTFRVDLEHMQYLTLKSCEFIAKNYNLEIVHLERVGHPSLFAIESEVSSLRKTLINFKRQLVFIPGLLQVRNFLKKKKIKNKIERDKGEFMLFCIFKKIGV